MMWGSDLTNGAHKNRKYILMCDKFLESISKSMKNQCLKIDIMAFLNLINKTKGSDLKNGARKVDFQKRKKNDTCQLTPL